MNQIPLQLIYDGKERMLVRHIIEGSFSFLFIKEN